MQFSYRNPRALLALATAFIFTIAPLATAAQQSVTVVVNGQTVNFDQPPVERAGRVFVPLRGVFERLGASVVYANGQINATGNGRNISLRIGSNVAYVNGNQTTIDVAPFLIGARTLVPLRFVAQALGANVDYNDSSRTVAINGNGNGYAPPPSSGVQLVERRPSTGGTVSARSPAISATFSQPVDPNSLHITLDGRDVTSTAYASQNRFSFTPTYEVPSGTHTVHVTGNAASGGGFDQSWSFTSTGSAANYINRVTPPAGASVGGSFTLTGHTRPGSTVHVEAASQTVLGHVIAIGTGAVDQTVTADGYGNFSTPINLNTVPGGTIRAVIQSVAPDGAAASVTLNYPS